MSFNQNSGYVKLNNNLFSIYNLELNCEHVLSVGAI
jgi:hypothetical protein